MCSQKKCVAVICLSTHIHIYTFCDTIVLQDAEKEQMEMADASGLHVIIFDEIDAICKSRG